MSEQVTPVVELPVTTSALKRWSKRAVIAAVAAGAVALVIVKVRGNDEESDTDASAA